MNFGNPERPEIMGQFVGVIEGIREACLALDYPVVSGNVSLYNETSGRAILPTPVIGGVGLIADAAATVDLALAEMAMAGMRGLMLDPFPTELPLHGYLFGEDQARYLIETPDPRKVLDDAGAAGVPARLIGVVGGASLTLSGAGAISIDALRATNEAWLPGYMAQD